MNTGLVFLCGFPSSGTDLLKNVINSHPDVYISGEFPFLYRLAAAYGETIAAGEIEEVIAALRKIDVYHNFANPRPDLPPDRAYSFAEIYATMVTKTPRRWMGNKTPQNTEHIDALRLLFPKAKFIVITRDVRDIALSWANKWGKHEVLCAHKWNARMMRGAQLLKDLEPHDYLFLKYEKLLGDFEETARRICDFLAIEYHDSMKEFHKSVDHVVDGKLNYGRALMRDNANKWKTGLSSKEIRRIEEVAFEALRNFDYPLTLATKGRALTKWEKIFGFAHDIYALVFIGNRAIKGSKVRDRWKTIAFEVRKLYSRLLHKPPAHRSMREQL